LVLIKHRASDADFAFVENVMSCLGSKHVYLTADQHDRITADTQAVTHAAFLSMGAAWSANNQFPWESDRYVGGIENVKQNITLRIYSNKWHVYAGLAIMNPSAKKQIKQYAESVTELFKLMLAGNRDELRARVHAARKAVFGENSDAKKKLLLRDELLDQFSLGVLPEKKLKNNHLSLLAMADCWWKLGIVPYDHMICSTPVSLAFTMLHCATADMCTALTHVARHHRVSVPQPHTPRRGHRHSYRRQHISRR
jgi:prephenate dehydrogenase (NADP+)